MTDYRSDSASNSIDALRHNIEQHLACTEALLATLEQERSALLGDDPALLEQVSAAKSVAVGNLQKLAQQLAQIPGARGAELERRIRQGGDALQRQWQALMAKASSCQQANLANGALLEAKQSQVKWALGHMLGSSQTERTYGPAGFGANGGARRIIASV